MLEGIEQTVASTGLDPWTIIYVLAVVIGAMGTFIAFLIKKIFKMQDEWVADLRAAQEDIRDLHGGE